MGTVLDYIEDYLNKLNQTEEKEVEEEKGEEEEEEDEEEEEPAGSLCPILEFEMQESHADSGD